MDLEEAKILSKETYRMDETILYSFNPITAKPIILFEDSFICPLHLLLFWQITNGLYYQIVKESGFNEAFGEAFENYIGEVIDDIIEDKEIILHKDFIYGKEEKRTSDWIMIDKESIVFIECKSKRMTISSKSELDVKKGLESDIDKMASFVTQIYKTFIDYKNNKYVPIDFDENLTLVPIIVTLEPWFINYNLRIPEMVKTKVKEKFKELEMDIKLIENYPYHIFSSEEFESEVQIISDIGGKQYSDLYRNEDIREFKSQFEYKKLFAGQYEKIFVEPLKGMTDK
jgi:hypothetical protein